MAAPAFFPLLVEGSWGPYPPNNLSTKLQVYFQSRKRSGGGECEVRQEPGNPERFLVLFHRRDGERRLGRVWAVTTRLSRLEKLGSGARSGRNLRGSSNSRGELQNGPRVRGVEVAVVPLHCACRSSVVLPGGGGRTAQGIESLTSFYKGM